MGDLHPQTLTAENNYAMILINQNKFEEAEPLLRDVLSKRMDVFGDDHPSTLSVLNNLASLLEQVNLP